MTDRVRIERCGRRILAAIEHPSGRCLFTGRAGHVRLLLHDAGFRPQHGTASFWTRPVRRAPTIGDRHV